VPGAAAVVVVLVAVVAVGWTMIDDVIVVVVPSLHPSPTPTSPQGDTHLGGGFDTNGSTESFELVAEEGNGEAKGTTEGSRSLPPSLPSFLPKSSSVHLAQLVHFILFRSRSHSSSSDIHFLRTYFYFVFFIDFLYIFFDIFFKKCVLLFL